MEYLIGVILALALAASTTVIGLDRARSFYPTVVIVVAHYYALFAVMGASNEVLVMEVLLGLGFAFLAVVGFKKSMWLVAAALAGHGFFDLAHHLILDNPGMPIWWPGFCASVDILLGAWVALRLLRNPGYPVEPCPT